MSLQMFTIIFSVMRGQNDNNVAIYESFYVYPVCNLENSSITTLNMISGGNGRRMNKVSERNTWNPMVLIQKENIYFEQNKECSASVFHEHVEQNDSLSQSQERWHLNNTFQQVLAFVPWSTIKLQSGHLCFWLPLHIERESFCSWSWKQRLMLLLSKESHYNPLYVGQDQIQQQQPKLQKRPFAY